MRTPLAGLLQSRAGKNRGHAQRGGPSPRCCSLDLRSKQVSPGLTHCKSYSLLFLLSNTGPNTLVHQVGDSHCTSFFPLLFSTLPVALLEVLWTIASEKNFWATIIHLVSVNLLDSSWVAILAPQMVLGTAGF